MSKLIIADLIIDEVLHVNDNEQKMISGGGGVGSGGTGNGTPNKLFLVENQPSTEDFSLYQPSKYELASL
jgi:hypothetical protein